MSGIPGRFQKWILAGGIGLCITALFVGGAWAYLKYGNANPNDGANSSSAQEEINPAPVSEDVVNLLVCGVDDPAGLTDVIMYVSFDVKAGKVNVLQIPRDSYIGDDYRTGKINQVYYAHRKDDVPIQGLIDVIGEQYQLPVDHYLLIRLEAFRNLVDAVGGVDVDVPVRIDFGAGNVIEPGPQHLDGEKAEWFARYRAGYVQGDIGRVNARTLMLEGLMRAVKAQGRMDLLRIAMRYFDQVETDIGLDDALSLANAAFQLEPEDLHVDVVEGRGLMYNGYAVYEVDEQSLTKLLNERYRPYQEPVENLSVSQIPLPPSVSEPESQPETSAEDNSTESSDPDQESQPDSADETQTSDPEQDESE